MTNFTVAKDGQDWIVISTETKARSFEMVPANHVWFFQTKGEAAAQAVINLWPVYAQVEYDAANAVHVEVAEMGVIAMLWRRGGSSSAIEQVKWDEVFGDDGLISRVRRTGPRGRAAPSSNSGVQQAPERDAGGRLVRGWADTQSLPSNYMPIPRSVE